VEKLKGKAIRERASFVRELVRDQNGARPGTVTASHLQRCGGAFEHRRRRRREGRQNLGSLSPATTVMHVPYLCEL